MSVGPGLLAASFAHARQPYLLQARQMQALSFVAHIPLVCFAIAFPSMVLAAEWRHQRTGQPVYRTLARRWTRVLAALFAVGVITGTILSFEMGLLWPAFTATFGSVFGVAFAVEGFAFFIEAIFIGIFVYGRDRLPPRVHLLSGVPIVVAGLLGSTMVIAVNGWMNHPEGFRLVHGRVTDVHPISALYANSYFWHELVHMYLGGYMVAGFLVAGVYAWGRGRGRWGPYERSALTIALTVAAIAAPLEVVAGDWAGRSIAHHQPVKLAAAEALDRTTRGAPERILGSYSHGHTHGGVAIPDLLSFLAYDDTHARVTGLDAVSPGQRPPVNVVHLAFDAMVAIGTTLAVLGLAVLVVRVRRRRLPRGRWWDRAIVLAGPLALVALVAGWTVTEVGRQPWVVYGVMRTSAAVTGAHGIPVGYATLVVVYVSVAGAVAWLLRRLGRMPLEPGAQREPRAEREPAPGGAR